MKKIIITLLGVITFVSGYCQKYPVIVNNVVVGYTTEEQTGEMPDALKELLGVYDSIPVSTRGDLPEWFISRNVEPIQPLITTRWNQTPPYNDSIPKKKGICVYIANAQMMHYYRVNRTYMDMKDFPITIFNHDLILDEYEHTSSVESRQEVAKLVKCCAQMMSDNLDSEKVLGLKRCKYSKTMIATHFPKLYAGILHSSTYEFLDSCLDSATPVMTYGVNDAEEGHCFIIDGRDSDGLYHINWGWGGYYDGYYAISDIFDDTRTNSKFTVDDFIILKTSDLTSSVDSEKRNSSGRTSVFDLYGKKVGESMGGLSKGIYIVKGKKYVIR